MLTALQLQQQRRRRAVPSLRQQYQEYILQRIEGYKNSLPRQELLELGNAAVLEMEAAQGEQFLLTEVLLTDWVDRIIHRRLSLQPYSRWSRHFRKLRAAQREPTRWDIEPESPIVRLLPRLEPGDSALVLGSRAAPHAFLLAAHEVEVSFVGHDMTLVDQIESRVAEEALGHHCSTFVAPAGRFPPGLPEAFHVVALDTGVLEAQTPASRRATIHELMEYTAPGGIHLLLPGDQALAPEAYLTHYGEWIREEIGPARRRRGSRSLGVLLGKPPAVPEDSAAIQPRNVFG